MFTIINYKGKLDFLAWAFGRDERLAGEPFYSWHNAGFHEIGLDFDYGLRDS
jgi:hypothetical protein